jgi:flagellar biosynthesis/type III secretory pathway chaperone
MTMQPDACRHGMYACLLQEIDLAQQFSILLGQEFSAITTRDIATLEAIIRDKRLLVEQLENLEQQRNALLDAAGFITGPEGTGACLQWCDRQQQLASQWDRLQVLAAECRQKNRKNRLLIELCGQHTYAALCVLRGEEPRLGTYGADGDTKPQHGSRSLTRA